VPSRDSRNSATCGSAPPGASPAPNTADLFIHEPIRYAPQYGGFCTLSVAAGDAANIDPEAGRIVDGRLYVFNAKEGLEADFDAVPAETIARAEVNWPTVKLELEGH
jgi:hypothetical protein